MSAGNGNGNTSSGFFSRRKPSSSTAQISQQPVVIVDNPEVMAELKQTQDRLKIMEDKFDRLILEVKRGTEQRVARRNNTVSMQAVSVSSTTGDVVPKADSGKVAIEEET